jgi:Zn-dependent oligopeptidase
MGVYSPMCLTLIYLHLSWFQFTSRTDVLRRLSKHYKTGAALDVETIARLAAAKHYLSAKGHRHFLALAAFDMVIHGGEAP